MGAANSTSRHLSVQAKVSGTIVLVVLAAAIFQYLYFPGQQIVRLKGALEGKAESLARVIGYELASALEFADTESAKRALEGASSDPDYAYSAVFEASGKVFAAHQLNEAAAELEAPTSVGKTPTTNYLEESSILQVTLPISSTAGAAGTLVMAFSTRAFEKVRWQIIKWTLVAALIMFVIGLGIAYLVGSSIGRRLKELEHVADKVAAGDLSVAAPRDLTRDEIGRMGQAFATMLESFKQLRAQFLQVAEGDLSGAVGVRGDLAEAFERLVFSLRGLREEVERVAGGDLASTTDLKGDLAEAFNKMILSQRQLVRQITETALQLTTASSEFQGTARSQQRGALQQSSAVEENRRTMDSLVVSARTIAETAQDVLHNAEKADENSRLVAEHITALSSHTTRITEFLQIIKEIANKSNLLALNAALEGTKAGEVGRGFSLVAKQMQRLAANVMESVVSIKDLTRTITEATRETVRATEESTRLAADTTQSARQIAMIVDQQKIGTEQVTKAMEDVANIARQTAAGTKQVAASSEDLVGQADRLQQLMSQFRIEEGGSAAERAS